jgi:hypothetical protein
LSEAHIDIKNTHKDPTMNYIPKPKAPSKTLLEAQRKDELLNQLK